MRILKPKVFDFSSKDIIWIREALKSLTPLSLCVSYLNLIVFIIHSHQNLSNLNRPIQLLLLTFPTNLFFHPSDVFYILIVLSSSNISSFISSSVYIFYVILCSWWLVFSKASHSLIESTCGCVVYTYMVWYIYYILV